MRLVAAAAAFLAGCTFLVSFDEVPSDDGGTAVPTSRPPDVNLAETGVGTPAWSSAKEDGLEILATLSPGGLADFDLDKVPTFKSAGADYVVDIQYGFAIRAETPPERIEILTKALHEVVEDPAVKERFKKIDLILKWTPPDEYAAKMKDVAESAAGLKAFLEK